MGNSVLIRERGITRNARRPVVFNDATGAGAECCCGGTGPCGCFDVVSPSCGIGGGEVSYRLGAAFVGTYDLAQDYYTESLFETSSPQRFTWSLTQRYVARVYHDVNTSGRCVVRVQCIDALIRLRQTVSLVNTGEVINETLEERIGCANYNGSGGEFLFLRLTDAMEYRTEFFLPFVPDRGFANTVVALDPPWTVEGACTQVERFKNNYFGRGEIFARRTTTMALAPFARSISMIVPTYSLVDNQGITRRRGQGSHVASVAIQVTEECDGQPPAAQDDDRSVGDLLGALL